MNEAAGRLAAMGKREGSSGLALLLAFGSATALGCQALEQLAAGGRTRWTATAMPQEAQERQRVGSGVERPAAGFAMAQQVRKRGRIEAGQAVVVMTCRTGTDRSSMRESRCGASGLRSLGTGRGLGMLRAGVEDQRPPPDRWLDRRRMWRSPGRARVRGFERGPRRLRRTDQADPELPFEGGPMDGWEPRESGLWLMASVAPKGGRSCSDEFGPN